MSQIITDPSTHEIKPNMFSSLPIMEMDNLTERTITDDVIQNLYLIFFLTSQASNFIYTAVYLYINLKLHSDLSPEQKRK